MSVLGVKTGVYSLETSRNGEIKKLQEIILGFLRAHVCLFCLFI